MPPHVWRAEGNLKELILSFYVVGPGIELKLSELVAAGKPYCWFKKYDLMSSLKYKEARKNI